MVQKVRLEPGITEIQTFFKNNQFRAFAVDTTRGTILIDTCMEDDTKDFLKIVQLMKVKMIILTHHHRDHTGALAGIVEKYPSIQIAAHKLEVDKIPVQVTRLLEDKDLILDTLRVIHVPGHTAGNIALFHVKEKLLFTGDSVFGAGGFQGVLSSPPQVYSEDVDLARKNVARLLEYPFKKAYLSHGEHLLQDAQEQIRSLIDDSHSD